jgi:hypothetical protein
MEEIFEAERAFLAIGVDSRQAKIFGLLPFLAHPFSPSFRFNQLTAAPLPAEFFGLYL